MPRGNPNGMTAKKAVSTLRGELVLARAAKKSGVLLARRHGSDATAEAAGFDRQIAALEYALAATLTFKASGKSALKAAERAGLSLYPQSTPTTGQAEEAPDEPEDDDDEYDV